MPGRVSPGARLVVYSSGPVAGSSGVISTFRPAALACACTRSAMAATPCGEFDGDSHCTHDWMPATISSVVGNDDMWWFQNVDRPQAQATCWPASLASSASPGSLPSNQRLAQAADIARPSWPMPGTTCNFQPNG